MITGIQGGLKLGLRPKKEDRRDLALANYIDRERIVEAMGPAAYDWSVMPAPNGETITPDRDPLGNDVAGDCVFAAIGHLGIAVAKLMGSEHEITTPSVLKAYAERTGYDPATGENDNGAFLRDELKHLTNVGMLGLKARAFVTVNQFDPVEVAIAGWIGCGLIGGYDLPLASQDQTDDFGRPLWDVPKGGWPKGQGPGTWGGHAMWNSAASPRMRRKLTWGYGQPATREWEESCCRELYMVLLESWMPEGKLAPNGFAFEDLLADKAARQAVSP